MNLHKLKHSGQSGAASVMPVFLIIIAVGILTFLMISSTAPFKSSILASIFPRQASHAASDFVNQQYYLELQPYPTVIMSKADTTAYVEYALLKDMRGNVVTDQSDMEYHWSIDSSTDPIATITPTSVCSNGIIQPCPNDHITINTLPNSKSDFTLIRVEVISDSSQTKIAEAAVPLSLTGSPVYSFQVKSPNGGESFSAGQNVLVSWGNGSTPVDSYVVNYIYYRDGVLKRGMVGNVLSGTTSINWTIPQELRSHQVKILITAKKNGLPVGEDGSNDYFSVN